MQPSKPSTRAYLSVVTFSLEDLRPSTKDSLRDEPRNESLLCNVSSFEIYLDTDISCCAQVFLGMEKDEELLAAAARLVDWECPAAYIGNAAEHKGLLYLAICPSVGADAAGLAPLRLGWSSFLVCCASMNRMVAW